MKTFTGLALALIIGVGTFTGQRAEAAELLWANVTIDRVLQTQGPAQARLTEVGSVFTYKLFNINNERQNAMLGILLAAAALNKQVRIAFFDGDPATIQLVGLINDAQ